jgi:antitoxin component YwqK of YwqJK toxin-antitoxin module
MTTKRVLEESLEYGDDGFYRHEGELFTGTAFALSDEGWIETESEYREGVLWGTSRGWFGPDRLAYEHRNISGLQGGVGREWHENGRLAAEELYEHGIRLRGKRWDREGNLIEDYHLQETDPDFRTLQIYRDAYGPGGEGTEPESPAPPWAQGESQ